ncbi:PAS domain-containing protein [Virgibacillus halodenitrificans]|uniref:sigma-54 interaction domain-containing protein n=1 Tax=Virgibacillus halodenitrificans TaxID=1482 RepID=UPI00136DB9CE|nr:sigma 54-interacting transcriptional regulator [Virgibacillus halodenitrificans]MYL47284.1 PAS domain-containing protein [Virgibacillus halodenitrificans]
MEQKVILILTKEVAVYEVFRNTLHENFGNSVQFRSNHYPPVNMNEVDLILSSGPKKAFRDIIEQLNDRIPYIQANRSIDFYKLEKLLEVKSNTKCLLVSNDTETALESVTLLQRLGFEHLKLIAFAPDMEEPPQLDEISVVITHGLQHLVPKGMHRIIDLGDRSLDLSTIFEISTMLKLSLDKTHLFTMDYFRNFVRIGRRLSASIQSERLLNKQLEIVLDAAHEGIIWVDYNGIVTVFNKEATSILGISNEDAIGKYYSDVVRDLDIEEVMLKKIEIPRQIIHVHGLQILITKTPIVLDNVFSGAVITFQDVSHVQRMEQEIRKKKTESGLTIKYTFDSIIGISEEIEKLKKTAKKLAKSDYTILISGESGTGKEIFAQAIHEHSSRRKGPFVAVNFAGITQSLAESELFGYEEGAFTGARSGGSTGLFELAQNGTIFLDEIGDAPLNIQAAILRVLQEKQVKRVGGNKVIPVDVRVIAATNKDLAQMIEKGTFREDLFYRLNQLPLEILPLRERKEDIPYIINYFLNQRKIKMSFTPEVEALISTYHWPGNVRELEGFINYVTVTADSSKADMEQIPPKMKKSNISQHRIELAKKYLDNHGGRSVFKKILEVLVTYTDKNIGIGRGSLHRLLDIEITESQLRTRMETLRRADCIAVGTKKQGTKITSLGQEVYGQL